MEENKRKGPGLFYGVMGVATLVVAIIGATFAYFSVTATSEPDDIDGSAAKVGIELVVDRVSASNDGLIPLDSEDMDKALAGDTAASDVTSGEGEGAITNKYCIDKNGNTVCQIYSVNVKNVGSSTVVLKGTGVINAKDEESTFDALKWQKLDTTATAEVPATAFALEEVEGIGSVAYAETIPTGSYTEFAEISLEADEDITYYIVVWIENDPSTPQEEENTGSYTGIIKFNSADGSGVSSTFSV